MAQEAKQENNNPQEKGMRLNKFLAHAGIASRRKCDELIKSGYVKVDGEVVTEMGYRVMPRQEVTYNGNKVKPQEKVYVLLNKPRDYITTTDDEKDRNTVMELVKKATDQRIYPVGRLDRNTSGLLLLTNDGELAKKLMHPKYKSKKVYEVKVDKPVTKKHAEQLLEGIELDDGVAAVDDIAYPDQNDKRLVGVEVHIGKNRVIRRMFEHLGYRVVRLDRVIFAGLTKKNLPRGKWRFLTKKEVGQLKQWN
jgi:23S rRNA pseudouridine2605 synthase